MTRIAGAFILTIITMVLIFWSVTDVKGDDLKVYDERGQYQGRIRESRNGDLRIYDERGAYQGRIKESRNGDLRVYDEKGQPRGRIRE